MTTNSKVVRAFEQEQNVQANVLERSGNGVKDRRRSLNLKGQGEGEDWKRNYNASLFHQQSYTIRFSDI